MQLYQTFTFFDCELFLFSGFLCIWDVENYAKAGPETTLPPSMYCLEVIVFYSPLEFHFWMKDYLTLFLPTFEKI